MLNYAQKQYLEALEEVGVPDKEPEIADEELDSDIEERAADKEEELDEDEEPAEEEEESQFVEAYDDDIMGQEDLEEGNAVRCCTLLAVMNDGGLLALRHIWG